MTITDDLYMRLQGYAAKVGIKIKTGGDISPFSGDPADVPADEKTSTPMHQAFYGNTGATVHKWRGYLANYHRHLARFRNTPVRLLEIGVYRGGSLQLWRTYFGEQALIFGIDIDPICSQYDGKAGSVRIGSQADPSFLRSVVREMGGIDVVIDDGSHSAPHQKVSFDTLFPLLSPQGVYICEDTMTAYLPGFYGGGYRRKTNFLEVAKTIVDDLHADFHDRPQGVPNANRTIAGLHFYQGMVVIEKGLQPRPSHMKIPEGR